MVACAGTRARENVLMPAMQSALLLVIEPHARAVMPPEALEALDGLTETLASRDATLAGVAAAQWAAVRPWAVQGIEQSGYGPAVQESLMETIRQFDINMGKLNGLGI